MKGGKKKSSSLPSEAAGDDSCSRDICESDLIREAAEHQERDESPEDAFDGEEEPPSPVAGEKEEEENNEESEEIPLEEGNGDGDGYGEAENVKPKLAEGFYEIEAVRRKRTRKSQVQYLIKWRGWPERENTWEPVDNLMSCFDVIDAFEESLQSGKQRSMRKHKRKVGATHTQPKKKLQRQQCSLAGATYNVPAVKVRIIEEPTPSPPLNGLKPTPSTSENPADISGNGLSNGIPEASGAETYQPDRCTGAKKRKSGSVRRFKQATSTVMDDTQNALAGGLLATFVQEGSHNHEIASGDLVCRNKSDDSKDVHTITQLVKPIAYAGSSSNDMHEDVSVTFLAKRSDGKETLVDNKFLKMNNPLLLIDFYEQHLLYNPSK